MLYFKIRPLRPSIKFPPFISINKQKVVKIIFTKILFCKIESNKSIFVQIIFKSRKKIKKIIIITCKKNLKFTLLSFFKSENNPIKKTEKRKKNNK